MKAAALQNYQARMRRVLDHIDRHLDGDLDLDAASRSKPAKSAPDAARGWASPAARTT